jgi:cell division protease FtsH
MMGAERKSMVISEEEKKNTSYHEIGHALVARMLPGTDPIHKVTIIPRGRALGLTQQLPVDEKHAYPREYLLNNIVILLGGRAAEEIILKDFTTGAGNDIERATGLARKMVCEWGMSDAIGPLSYGKKEEQIFLGREFASHQDYSEETARRIDAEINKIVLESYDKAKTILSENIDLLHKVALVLLEKEVITGQELDDIIKENGSSVAEEKKAPAESTE